MEWLDSQTELMMDSLYLVDSSIYIFRAWHSLPDSMTSRDGEANNAFIGFTDFVWQFIQAEKPARLVFAFDDSLHQCQRRAIYPDYKANREPAPESLKRQFQWCRDWVRTLGISQVASHSYEADDLIGSLASLHRGDDCNIVILSADKDLAQLIREHDVWWSFATGQQFNYRGLTKKFGVRPEQIADQLALAGDKIDNIPGIPGVGMAIAARLLTRFDNLDNLRANLQQVRTMKFRGSERIMNLLIEHEAVLDISSRLTPIYCNVDEIREVDTRLGNTDSDSLERMMEQHRMQPTRREKWWKLIDSLQR